MCIPDGLTIFTKIARIVSGEEGAIEKKKKKLFFQFHMYLPGQLQAWEKFPFCGKDFSFGYLW